MMLQAREAGRGRKYEFSNFGNPFFSILNVKGEVDARRGVDSLIFNPTLN
jgi:hypothetical protein